MAAPGRRIPPQGIGADLITTLEGFSREAVDAFALESQRHATGGGFYDYPAGQKKTLWPGLRKLFEKPGAAWNMQDLKDRLLYRQAVETARCLSEGVLTTVFEANIGSIFGIGFPAWTGGAMQFIYGTGIDAFIERADALATRFGPGFALSGAVKDAIRRHQPVY